MDVATRKLVYAYLFDIETDKPMASRSLSLQVVRDVIQPYKFQYRNPLNEFVKLELVSSKPFTLQLKSEEMGFEAHETRDIELHVQP